MKRAAFGKERVILKRHGKAIAAVVPMDDVELLETMEDQRDIADALAARREVRRKATKSLEKLRAELGE